MLGARSSSRDFLRFATPVSWPDTLELVAPVALESAGVTRCLRGPVGWCFLARPLVAEVSTVSAGCSALPSVAGCAGRLRGRINSSKLVDSAITLLSDPEEDDS